MSRLDAMMEKTMKVDRYEQDCELKSTKRQIGQRNDHCNWNYLTFFGSLIFAAVVCTGVFGQNDPANPQRGIAQGASYSISEIETINTTNGNLMLNIPLVGLPKGRGTAGASISLMYNSKLFDTVIEETLDQSQQMALQNFVHPSPDGGWKYIKNDYFLDLENRFETYSPGECDIGEYAWAFKLFMRMPDGSKKEFNPTGFDDIYNDGFYDVTPDGKRHHPCPINPTTYSTSGMVYHSTDGSFTRLVVDYVANALGGGAGNPWTMTMPDGGRVTGGGGNPSRVYDRNGNYVEGVEDQLGRELTIQLNAGTNEDHISMLGVDGEVILWKVFWKTIAVQKDYTTTGSVGGIGRGGSSDQTFQGSFKVVDRIELPTQFGDLEYVFTYNSENGGTGWGEIASITMPSGALAEYGFSQPLGNTTDKILQRYPNGKTLTYLAEYDGSSTEQTETWTYFINQVQSTITNPDGSYVVEYHGNTSYDHISRGLVYKTVSSNGNRTDRHWAHHSPPVGNNTVYINPYVTLEFTTIADASGTPSLTKIVDYAYDLNGSPTETKEYDWVSWGSVPKDGQGNPTGVPGGATLKRITVNEYYNSPTGDATKGYWHIGAPQTRNVLKSTEIQNSSSTPVSRSEFTYDDVTDTANLTQTKTWDSFKGGSAQSYSNPLTGTNSISTTATYNGYGMPLTATDANGNVTSITYGNVTCPGGTVTDLYPTQTVAAYGTAVARTLTAVYDCYTGLTTSTTDEDNDVTNSSEYDDVGRPVKSITADGTALEQWIVTEYHDEDRFVVVRSDLETVGDGKKVATQFFDQLGRVRLTKRLENAPSQSSTNETDGIKAQTRYKTVSGYTYQLASNPYRGATSSAATGEESMGWTLSTAWSNGRRSEVETFAGAGLPTVFGGGNTNSTGIIRTDIDADRTLVTDQAGKSRISKTNALGQLKEVWEILATSETGSESITFPNTSIAHGFKTQYNFDTLNNLTTVSQGVQTRAFTYSSLSRLLSATNPESGTISYGYDPNGNLTSKVDARNIATSYVYDALNRVTQRNYTNEPSGSETPNVVYTYKTTAPGFGNLIKVESSVSTTEYTSFDILGRVTAHKQTTDGTEYTTGYVYNLGGALIEETYPSGRVVKNVLDNNGDLSMVQSRKSSNYGYWSYANSFTYNATGAVTSMQLGNGKWESTTFNSRLQPTQIALGTVQNETDKLKLEYGYGTTANNGNVLSQKITVKRPSQSDLVFDQAYTYDSLNRITSAEETTDTTVNWNQTYTFDRYGNRNFNESLTTTLPKNCGTSPNFTVCSTDVPIVNPSVSATTNRLTGTTYDAAGNVITDAEGRHFTYDAENKQIEVESSSEVIIGTYYFDGDGKRVKKIVPGTGEVTVFVNDAGGKLVAEYSTIIETQEPRVQYLTNDHLGSPRVNTDQNGLVVSRTDYMPYGEEIVGLGNRTINENYVADDVRQGFTGYENDGETGLDFAQARMYRSGLGRFTGSDPLHSSGRIENPQTWNRFIYVLGNPLKYSDPLGLYEWDESAGGDFSDEELESRGQDRSLTKRERKRARKQLQFRIKFRAQLAEARALASDESLFDDESHQQTVAESVNSYGRENDGNNVRVGLGPSRGATSRLDQELGLIFVTFREEDKGKNLVRAIAHEGRHVADAQEYWSEGSPYSSLDRTHFDRERRAYFVSSYVAQAQGLSIFSKSSSLAPGDKYRIWNRGWKAAEREEKRSRGINNYIQRHYGYTESSQGTTYSGDRRLRQQRLTP